MIEIKSKKDGFRRCGIAHSREATRYPAGRFTAAELAILQAEPMLTVAAVMPDNPPAPAPDPVIASAARQSPDGDTSADQPEEPATKHKAKGKK